LPGAAAIKHTGDRHHRSVYDGAEGLRQGPDELHDDAGGVRRVECRRDDHRPDWCSRVAAESDDDWNKVIAAATELAETTNLLMVPGRRRCIGGAIPDGLC
jgi:predicted ATPase